MFSVFRKAGMLPPKPRKSSKLRPSTVVPEPATADDVASRSSATINEGKKLPLKSRRGSSIEVPQGVADLVSKTIYADIGGLRNAKYFPAIAPNYILKPNSPFRTFWDGLTFIVLMFVALVTPFEVAFVEETNNIDGLFITNRLVDLIFLIDMCLNLFTGQYDKSIGMWRVTIRTIWGQYCRSWFPVDIVSIIPFDMISFFLNSSTVHDVRILRIVRILRLVKLVRMIKGSRVLARWENQIEMSYNVKDLIKLVVGALALAHWMACAYRLAVALENHPESWITAYHLNPEDVYTVYVTALYWSVMTMTTVGYGDVPPQSNPERMVATMCMLIGAAAFAFVLGSICGLVASLDPEAAAHRALMDNLYDFVKESHIPAELKVALRGYFNHCRKLRKQKGFGDLLDDMSPELRGRVMHHTYSKWLSVVPFLSFQTKAPKGSLEHFLGGEEYKAFVMMLAARIKPASYAPMEVVLRVNQLCDTLHLVHDGIASTRSRNVSAGQYFGEEMLLSKFPRRFSVTALTYLDSYTINRVDLMDVIDTQLFPRMRRIIRRATFWAALTHRFPRLARHIWLLRNHPKDASPTARLGLARQSMHRLEAAVLTSSLKPNTSSPFRALVAPSTFLKEQHAEREREADMELRQGWDSVHNRSFRSQAQTQPSVESLAESVEALRREMREQFEMLRTSSMFLSPGPLNSRNREAPLL